MMALRPIAALACLALAACVHHADSHGSMIMPPSRNSVDADLPA